MLTKKQKVITVLIVVFMLMIGACSKTPASSDTFTSVCNKYGYTVSEDKEALDGMSAYDINSILLATDDDNAISYLVFENEDEAKSYFGYMKENYAKESGHFFSFLQKNNEELSFYDYNIEFRTVRIDNIVFSVSLENTEENKSEIKKMLTEMGY